MTVATPFLIGPATSRSNPWRIVVDPDRTGGMSLGDARLPPHTFANLGDDEVWSVGLINPTGLERFFGELAEYLESLTGPPDPDVILAMNARYGVYPAGPG